MPTYLLDDSVAVTLDASGDGEAFIGPIKPHQIWKIKHAAVSVSSNTNEPEGRLYNGFPSPGTLLAGTYTGSNDSTDLDVSLHTGQRLTVQWTGGDSGATATLSVYGSIEDPR